MSHKLGVEELEVGMVFRDDIGGVLLYQVVDVLDDGDEIPSHVRLIIRCLDQDDTNHPWMPLRVQNVMVINDDDEIPL